VKFVKSTILNSNSEINIDERITFDSEIFVRNSRLNDVEDVEVKGFLFYDDNQDVVEAHLNVKGDMVCPCAISNVDVDVPCVTDSIEYFKFSKTEDENVHQVTGDVLDLYPMVFQLILAEVPISVVAEDAEYPSGNGWEVISESEYQEEKGKEIDPRLAKLKDFKLEDDRRD